MILARIGSIILLGVFAITAHAATFTIRSTDNATVGLNDTTVFTPVGGNNATTLGQARMNVLLEATRIWGTLLQSNVPILVDASFDSLTCDANSGTLAITGPADFLYRNPSGPTPNIFYVSALADALADFNVSGDSSADIITSINSSLDSDPACLGGRGFYYGLDHNHGAKSDLLLVMLHELAHGLGFTAQLDLTTGQGFVGSDNVERFDSFTQHVYDEQFGSAWPLLTDAQRVQSAAHTGKLAWDGASVNSQISRFSNGVTAGRRMQLYAPAKVSNGSSVSHFDIAITPDVLMEPNLTAINTSSTDITVCALHDIGWTVNVCPQYANNHPPSAVAQTVTTGEATAVTITLNGTDADSDPLTYAIATPPSQGTLSSISTTTPHTVLYTPNAGVHGADSFTFTVDDGEVTSPAATVGITLTPPPPPSSSGGGALSLSWLFLMLPLAWLRLTLKRVTLPY